MTDQLQVTFFAVLGGVAFVALIGLVVFIKAIQLELADRRGRRLARRMRATAREQRRQERHARANIRPVASGVHARSRWS